jgi:hypothetical protein
LVSTTRANCSITSAYLLVPQPDTRAQLVERIAMNTQFSSARS